MRGSFSAIAARPPFACVSRSPPPTCCQDWYPRSFLSRVPPTRLPYEDELNLTRTVRLSQQAQLKRDDLVERTGRAPSFEELAAECGVASVHELRVAMRDAPAARRALVFAHQRLVLKLAADYARRHLGGGGGRGAGTSSAMKDLAQDGTLALIRAIDTFNPEQGARLCTFAWYHVRYAMHVAAWDERTSFRLPISVHAGIADVRGTSARLRERLGREPTAAEIAGGSRYARSASRVETLHRLERAAHYPSSLHAPRYRQHSSWAPESAPARREERITLVASTADGPMAAAEREDELCVATSVLAAALRTELSPLEMRVLALRYGLDEVPRAAEPTGRKGLYSWRQVGTELGISEMRAINVATTAKRKLRSSSRAAELREARDSLGAVGLCP